MTSSALTLASTAAVLLLVHFCGGSPFKFPPYAMMPNCTFPESDLLAFPLNVEFLETEFFLCSAFGHGLDNEARELSMGGPPPKYCKKANLSPFMTDIVAQMAYQEIGHLRAIQGTLQNFTGNPGFQRPLLDLSPNIFAAIMDKAFDKTLNPPFDPYANDLNFLLASYVIPYVGLTGYVGGMPCLWTPHFKSLVGGLLAVESGQDAIIRQMLYERVNSVLNPYKYTVAQVTESISALRNRLGNKGVKDEGLKVLESQGAEGKISGNVRAGNDMSLAYARTPEEVLAILYGSGDVSIPGGFLPNGGNGAIARKYLTQ